MTFHKWKWGVIYIFYVTLMTVIGLEVTTPDPFHKDIKNNDIIKPKNDSAKMVPGAKKIGGTPLSTAMESVITFISVFVVGCVITLSVYSWKKFKPSSWR